MRRPPSFIALAAAIAVASVLTGLLTPPAASSQVNLQPTANTPTPTLTPSARALALDGVLEARPQSGHFNDAR
jgi:hypothetical protein